MEDFPPTPFGVTLESAGFNLPPFCLETRTRYHAESHLSRRGIALMGNPASFFALSSFFVEKFKCRRFGDGTDRDGPILNVSSLTPRRG